MRISDRVRLIAIELLEEGLTAHEVARILRASERTIRRWRRETRAEERSRHKLERLLLGADSCIAV